MMKTLLNLFLALSFLGTTRTPNDWELAISRGELQGICLAGEWMDARECKYVFVNPAELTADLAMIRKRIETLANAPMVADSQLFNVDRNTLCWLIVLNRDNYCWLMQVTEMYPHNQTVQDMLEESKLLYDCWDALRDAKCDYYYAHIRRQALEKLRNTLGVKAFEQGIMPPPVPTWRMMGVR